MDFQTVKETLNTLIEDDRYLFAASAAVGVASTLCKSACSGTTKKTKTACSSPPVADKMPTKVWSGARTDSQILVGEDAMSPPQSRVDDYYWLRDDSRSNPTVLNYLQAENKYTEEQTAHLSTFRDQLYQEMKSHMNEDDESVPYRRGEFMYYTRTIAGQPYKVHCRQRALTDSNRGPCTTTNTNGCSGKSNKLLREEIVLDENVLARSLKKTTNSDYCDVHRVCVSPSQTKAVISVDTTGNEVYSLRLKSGFVFVNDAQNVIENSCNADEVIVTNAQTDGSVEWTFDDSGLFYLTQDSEHRPCKLFLHLFNNCNKQQGKGGKEEDICLFEECDQMFWLQLEKSKDDQFLLLSSESKETFEVHVLSLPALQSLLSSYSSSTMSQEELKQQIKSLLKCVNTRVSGLRYSVEHRGSQFLIVTNFNNCINNQLVALDDCHVLTNNSNSGIVDTRAHWTSLRSYDSNEQIDFVLPFEMFVAVFGRSCGLPALWIIKSDYSTNNVNSNNNIFNDVANNNNSNNNCNDCDCVASPSTTTTTTTTTQQSHSTIPALLREWHAVCFPEKDCFSVSCGDNCDFYSSVVRITYSSFLTPKQTLDCEWANPNSLLVRKSLIVPNYDKPRYECRRLFATSRDGHTQIPVSLVFHKNTLIHKNGTFRYLEDNYLYQVPVMLYGYGSYGTCIDPSFDFKRLSLLDRGVVYAIAHVRGGGEYGHQWYEQEGKYLHKLNTFFDFVDVMKMLIARQITTPSQLSIVGRSAGGLLITAALNMHASSLCQCAVADVPFVDVLTTMSDSSIPLTITEWEEWGNPNQCKYYEYMSQYSPYDNLKPIRDHNNHSNIGYPSMLLTGGLHDPRVAYWEPAKYTAKLREIKKKSGDDLNPLLLKVDLSAGHFSASDRYKYLKEMAFEYAFVLEQIKAMEKIV